MNIYLLDDDKNVLNILKIIIKERKLGKVCGFATDGSDGLEDLEHLKPDIVMVDMLMPKMDGITFIKEARKKVPDAAYIMLSQVSSKDIIGAAYEAGIQFYIQKPLNSIEIENVITNVTKNLTMQRTLEKMQNIFLTEMSPPVREKQEMEEDNMESSLAVVQKILKRLGIAGEAGSRDILQIVEYLLKNPEQMQEATLNDWCSHFSDVPKSMEQRIRRTASAGMVNLANMGIEDYGNETFSEYSNTLYNFEQVKKEMDYIRGKSEKHGNIKIKNFIHGLILYSQGD
ncbi:MAG: response regulator [Lachnospiraceae bacterium]|nr:response regulator [Lachnospiraceae bacterium]